MGTEHADAVVVGSGPNGLTAANLLADAGWDVVVLEANEDPGGAVRSGALIEADSTHDLYSSFYPLGVASPVLQSLALEDHGLRWRRSELVVAHPRLDGSCAVLSRDLHETMASLEAFAAGDGMAWQRLYERWEAIGAQLLGALMSPFPPVADGARMAKRLGPLGLARFARFGMLPVARLGAEAFGGDGGPRLLAGNALHADLAPEAPGGALFGWVLCGLGQQVGFPVAEGGSGNLTAALVARLRRVGGRLECSRRVTRILTEGGRATGVVTEDGARWAARRAVLADVGAPALYEQLLDRDAVPARVLADIGRFQYDNATVKVDWTLDGEIPWSHPDVRRAGTVHVAEGVDALAEQSSNIARGLLPNRPFLVMGQYARTDPTRQPAGRETAWAYTHLPQKILGDSGPDGLQGSWDERETEVFVARMETQIEELAPGFGRLIRGRHVFTPPGFQRANANLVNGALNGGTAALHQQLVLRPIPGLGRSETPVDGLYMASASAHPGGGVHGACGANAARAALARRRPARLVRALARR